MDFYIWTAPVWSRASVSLPYVSCYPEQHAPVLGGKLLSFRPDAKAGEKQRPIGI